VSDDGKHEQPASQEAPRESWRRFLTPAAILLAGAMIGAALYFSRGSDDEIVITASEVNEPAAPENFTSELPSSGTPLVELLRGYADEAGLDTQAFDACLASGAAGEDIEASIDAGANLSITGTPTFFVNGIRIRGALPEEVFAAVIDAQLAGASNYPPQVVELSRGERPAIVLDPVQVPTSGGVSRGPAAAPVTLVEFADFQCPFCARWNLEVLPRLQAKYGEDLRVVFMPYPLSTIHGNASAAAVAAWCAHESGRFWEMHDTLFARQGEWATAGR
jgi:protein-disulfide isomerase